MEPQQGGAQVIKAQVPLAEMFGYATTIGTLSQSSHDSDSPGVNQSDETGRHVFPDQVQTTFSLPDSRYYYYQFGSPAVARTASRLSRR
jgi:hypothetical protein